MALTKYVLVVEYDGTKYYGFQWQPGLPTIQDEVEKAIKKFCGQSSRVVAASRTDAGVHAKGQVVSFWAKEGLSTITMTKALNYYLPRDIAVKAAYRTSDDFNVRQDALSREYCYYILNSESRAPLSEGFALHMPGTLDMKPMNKACHLILDSHDFKSFTTFLNNSRNTVRNVYKAEVRRKENLVIFRMIADSFLPHQVRNTVGLLIRLGLGKIGLDDFKDIMEARTPDLAGPRAPARGLCLNRVNYSKSLGVQQ